MVSIEPCHTVMETILRVPPSPPCELVDCSTQSAFQQLEDVAPPQASAIIASAARQHTAVCESEPSACRARRRAAGTNVCWACCRRSHAGR